MTLKLGRPLLTLVAAVATTGSYAAPPAPGTGAPGANAGMNAPRPNVVLILADALGYSDLGCYGSEIATPNIDRLAQQGVRLTQFYNQARCCPSRAALLTGRYPHQAGVGAMIDGYAKWQRDAADRPSYTDHLSKETPTIPELLRPAGYRTMMVGKWHLGDKPDQWPAARGFDRSFVLIPGAMNYWGGETTGPRAFMALDDKRWTPPRDGFFATDAFTDRAVEFVSEAKSKEQPFFLYLAYNAPHWPLHAPEKDIAEYKGKYDAGWQPIREQRFRRMADLGIVSAETQMAPMDHGQVAPWDQLNDAERQEWVRRMEIYAAQVTRMDRQIGRLLGTLDQLGVADNTLVLFVSDNGGAAEDPHRGQPGARLGSRNSFWGYARPWATVSNTPWRYHKVSAYEGGISTPLVARWPAGIPVDRRGALVREPGHLMDLLPTFLSLAGVPRPDGLEGQDISAMLRGGAGSPDRTFCWEHEGNRGIRKGKWKLVAFAEPAVAKWALYDLSTDRAETRDLAQSHPDVARQLAADYDAWAKRCNVAPWPEIAAMRPESPAAKK